MYCKFFIGGVMSKEYLGKIVNVKMDRPMGTKHPKHGFVYPVNYGYIPNTVSGDGEELDAYVLGVFKPVDTFEGKVIAIIHRTNDNDDKLVVVPEGKDYSDEQIRALTEFQEQWFESEIWREQSDYEVLAPNCKIRWIDNFQIDKQRYTQVSAYVYNEKNQLLIVKNGNTWTIPGGHPEVNETQQQTLERELMEEACVTLKEIKYIGAVEVVEDDKVYYQLRYTAKVDKILPFKQEYEISERNFVNLDELTKFIKWANGETFQKQILASKKVWNI